MCSAQRSIVVAAFAGVLCASSVAGAEAKGADVAAPPARWPAAKTPASAAPPSAGKATATSPPAGEAASASSPDADLDEEELSDEAELARIVGLVGAARYEECAARLSELLGPKSKRPLTDPDVIETARIYDATCLLGLDKPEAADEPLRAAIRKNPQMRAPDSLVFPQKVVDRFLKVREELYSELRAAEAQAIDKARRQAREKQRRDSEDWARMLLLERLARQEVLITKNHRYIAMVPFGVGQFQNADKPLGWLFFGAEAALGISALTSLGVHSHLQAQADRIASRGGVAPGVGDRLHAWWLALNVSTYGLIGVAAVGITQAQVAFVPEVRTVRERKLPPLNRGTLELAPNVAVGAGGLELGLTGRF